MKKNTVFHPPAATAKGQRLVPSSKHAVGIRRKGRHAKLAAKATAKSELIDKGQREAIRLANEKALRKAYAQFYSTPEGRAFAKTHRKSSEKQQRRSDSKNGLEFADPADLPESVGCGSHNGRKLVSRGEHPVDAMEPRKLSVQVEGLSEFTIKRTSETFGLLLRWALESDDIVVRGLRAIVIIAAMRPDLAAGFVVDYDSRLDLLCEVSPDPDDVHDAGKVFGPFLEFIGRGPVKSAIGERLDITAYFLRPDLLPESTLAKLGEILNKSRQAKSKLSNDVRDTFNGVKAPAMRPEVTRDRCRDAQVRGGLTEATA